jgi:hypothetical protein
MRHAILQGKITDRSDRIQTVASYNSALDEGETLVWAGAIYSDDFFSKILINSMKISSEYIFSHMEPKHYAAIAAAIATVILIFSVAVYVLGGLAASETVYSKMPYSLLKYFLKNENETRISYTVYDYSISGILSILSAGALAGAISFITLAPSL